MKAESRAECSVEARLSRGVDGGGGAGDRGEVGSGWSRMLVVSPIPQQIFEVDPLVCPSCHGAMRIVACITQTSVIDQILTHLRTRASREAHAGPRSPPSTRAPASRGASRAPRPFADAPPVP